MLIMKDKDTGDIIVSIGDDEDYEDLVKGVIDACHFSDVTIRVNAESQEHIKDELWGALQMRVEKRDLEKSKALIFELLDLERTLGGEEKEDESI